MTTQSHTLVYRVEDAQGHGPYNGAGLSMYAMAKSHGRGGEFRHRTPVPEEDGLGFLHDSSYFFGFESLGSLFEWFDGYAQSLHVYGFAAYVYRVEEEHVERGKRQVVFRRQRAEKVQKIELGCSNPARDDHLDAMHSKAEKEQAKLRMQRVKDDLTKQSAMYTKMYEPIQPRTMDEQLMAILREKPRVPDELLRDLAEKGPLVSTVSEDWEFSWDMFSETIQSFSKAEFLINGKPKGPDWTDLKESIAKAMAEDPEPKMSCQNDDAEFKKAIEEAKKDVKTLVQGW